MMSANIQQRINAITTTSFSFWCQHDENGTEGVVPYFEDVLPALGKSNGQYKNQPLLDWLLAALEQKEDEDLRWRAADALGKMGEAVAQHPDVLDRLLAALEQKEDWSLRWRAANALGKMGEAAAQHPDVLKALLAALEQKEDEDLRWKAADALGKMGEAVAQHPDVRNRLLAALEQKEDEALRWMAASALGKMEKRGARFFLNGTEYSLRLIIDLANETSDFPHPQVHDEPTLPDDLSAQIAALREEIARMRADQGNSK